jgi:hypothetical protein
MGARGKRLRGARYQVGAAPIDSSTAGQAPLSAPGQAPLSRHHFQPVTAREPLRARHHFQPVTARERDCLPLFAAAVSAEQSPTALVCFSAQSQGHNRGHGFLHGANSDVPGLVLFFPPRTRPAQDLAFQWYRKPEEPLDRAATERGFVDRQVKAHPGFQLGPLDLTLEPGKIMGLLGLQPASAGMGRAGAGPPDQRMKPRGERLASCETPPVRPVGCILAFHEKPRSASLFYPDPDLNRPPRVRSGPN